MAAGLFVIGDIKKLFVSWNVNDFVKPWLGLKWNSICKRSRYRSYNLTCSNLFLPLIPHQQKLLHPRATWHIQIHENNQQEAKNERYQEEMYSDVCLVSKDRRTTERSLLFQSNRQIRYRLRPRQQQRGRRGSGRPKVLSSQCWKQRGIQEKESQWPQCVCRVWITRQICIFVFDSSLGRKQFSLPPFSWGDC